MADSEEKRGEVIPLRILPGSGEVRSGNGSSTALEQRVPLPEDIAEVRQHNQEARSLLAEMGEIETHILAMATKKVEAYKRWQAVQAVMVESAKKAARNIDIDPESADPAWNLNLETGIFIRKASVS